MCVERPISRRERTSSGIRSGGRSVCPRWTPSASVARARSWRQLFDRYGEHLSDAFCWVLDQTARKSKHLKEDDFGPGIIDAEKALLQRLPSKRAVAGAVGGGRARRTRAARAKRGDNRPLANLHALFPQLSEAELRRGLEALLSTDSRGLTRRMREVGDEVVFQFASDPRLSRRFGASCRRAVGSGKTRAALRWRAAGSENLRGHLRRTGSGKLKKCLDQGG